MPLTPFAYPYADADIDVLPLWVMASGQRIEAFTDGPSPKPTSPTLSQVQAFIRRAASVVTMRLAGAGYCYPLAPRSPATVFDDATQDFLALLVGSAAAGMTHSWHVTGEKGPRLNGPWSLTFKLLDDLAEGVAAIPLCYMPGTPAAIANTTRGIPHIFDVAGPDMMRLPEYADYVAHQRWTVGFR